MKTAKQLLDERYTCNQVGDLLYDGQITEQIANEYFKEWSKGKTEHRWNSELNIPEQCSYNEKNGTELWYRFHW